jgi:hypothetical protein
MSFFERFFGIGRGQSKGDALLRAPRRRDAAGALYAWELERGRERGDAHGALPKCGQDSAALGYSTPLQSTRRTERTPRRDNERESSASSRS